MLKFHLQDNNLFPMIITGKEENNINFSLFFLLFLHFKVLPVINLLLISKFFIPKFILLFSIFYLMKIINTLLI